MQAERISFIPVGDSKGVECCIDIEPNPFLPMHRLFYKVFELGREATWIIHVSIPHGCTLSRLGVELFLQGDSPNPIFNGLAKLRKSETYVRQQVPINSHSLTISIPRLRVNTESSRSGMFHIVMRLTGYTNEGEQMCRVVFMSSNAYSCMRDPTGVDADTVLLTNQFSRTRLGKKAGRHVHFK
jgi:hypothetical protein